MANVCPPPTPPFGKGHLARVAVMCHASSLPFVCFKNSLMQLAVHRARLTLMSPYKWERTLVMGHPVSLGKWVHSSSVAETCQFPERKPSEQWQLGMAASKPGLWLYER